MSFADWFARHRFREPTLGTSAPASQELAREALHRLRQNVLLREYIGYTRSAPVIRHLQPWHARGEQLGMALTCYCAAAHDPSLPSQVEFIGRRNEIPYETSMYILGARLESAVPYLWVDDVHQAVLCSPPVPSHVISPSILPHPLMFWSYARAYQVQLNSRDGAVTEGETNFVLIVAEPEGIGVIRDFTDRSRIGYVSSVLWYGKRYPEDTQHPDATADVMRMLSFLRSDYVGKEETPLDRSQRRRLTRAGAPPAETEATIHVVTLRRPRTRPAVDEEAPVEGAKREWKHQWWVTGHHRAQWYPSEQAHHVKWIAPYPKGPHDKPMLEKVYKVQR